MSDIWPEINGKPAARVRNGAQELINIGNYSNVTIGPASVERFVEDDPDAIKEGMRECLMLSESVLAEERENVLKSIRDSKG